MILSALSPPKAKQAALNEPALVPMNISNISIIFLPLAASSFCKKTIDAIVLTPPPSKHIIFLLENLDKKLKKFRINKSYLIIFRLRFSEASLSPPAFITFL